MKTEEDKEFERMEREQLRSDLRRARELAEEQEKEKRCPTCHRLLKDAEND